MIQIGATDDAGKANELLDKAKAKRGALLASARPYTEKVQKGHGTIYRARFAGLEIGGASRLQGAETFRLQLFRDQGLIRAGERPAASPQAKSFRVRPRVSSLGAYQPCRRISRSLA